MTSQDRTLSHIAEQALDTAKRAGAEAADVMAVRSTGASMEVRKGALEQALRNESFDVGIRVLMGQRQATVAVSDIRPETLATAAERAVAMAREAPDDPYAGLADPAQLATTWDLASLDLVDPADDPSPQALADAALAAEAAAQSSSGISQVAEAGADAGRSEFWLMATNGFSGGYARTSRTVGCAAIAGEGLSMEQDYCYEMRAHHADLPTPEEVGQKAAARAVAAHGAGRPPTGGYPVVFDERISSSLISHLTAAISGAAITRGSSWLLDALGTPVLPETLDLHEEPLRPRSLRSRPFDAEGLPTARRTVVAGGVLQGWTLDLATARKLGMPSTANAARGAGGAPSPAIGNLALTQGAQDRAALLRDMGEGLLVTGLIGATINPNTGDYSRGASGFWVKGGEIGPPVNECTIAGNLRDMLRSLRPANDARLHASLQVPSLLVEGLTIAGN